MDAAAKRFLSGAELRALSGRSDARGAGRLFVHLAALVAAGWLVAQSGPLTIVPAMLLLGIVQAALFAPVHETMHLTAFASRRANAVVGWLLACPSLLDWHYYAAFHLAHHRHTQDPARDPELMTLPPRTLAGYMARIAGVPYWALRARVIADCWRGDLSRHPYVPPAARRRVVLSVRAMTVFVAGAAIGAALFWGWRTPLVFWVLPQLLGQPVLRAYLLVEHTACSEDANGLTNTRTTMTNAAVRLLMWNMPFHAEHHLYPSIPFHRLPDAHGALRDRLAVVQPGYARWHAGFVRGLRRPQPAAVAELP
ncbi:MAG: fatty acid desaturase [Alphaproteobacteria bacterium]|nr:fatty acid desaturase [Alphaproteobacteria bacterium]